MKNIEDKSVDLTVTSPPYDNLRMYNGYTFRFEEIAQQLFRITKEGGVVVWIVNDATINKSESLTSFKQAIYFVEECGFNLHDTMCYCKDNPLPSQLSKKRYAQQFEYAFIFSKGFPKTFNPIMEQCKNAGRKHKTGFRQKDGSIKKKKELICKDEKIKGNLWFYQVGYMKTTKDKIAFDHPAIFPDQLAHDHIFSWSNPGDIVFDPMCGSGTTLKQAALLNRKFIGCDISNSYCSIARTRIKTSLSPRERVGVRAYA